MTTRTVTLVMTLILLSQQTYANLSEPTDSLPTKSDFNRSQIKKDSIIQALYLQNKLLEQKIESQALGYWIEIIALALAASVLVVAFISYRLRSRHDHFLQWKHDQQLSRDFELQLAQYELTSLRAQMNPHFIFNSLNSINRYILKSDPDKASSYLTKFSKLIRKILDNSMTQYVALVHELEAVELYLQLESIRFEHKFAFEIHIAEDIKLDKAYVPPMIMQPYIENSIWHGLLPKETPGRITISIDLSNSEIVYTIEDNGIGREASRKTPRAPEEKKSYGMSITSNRLSLLTKQKTSSIKIDDLKNDRGEALGTRVTVKIPLVPGAHLEYPRARF